MNIRNEFNNTNYNKHIGIINNDPNPFNHFQPNNLQEYPNNFNKSFNPNKTILLPIDTTNRNTTIHNNINNNIQNECITEYTINIDSMDRDTKIYPSPYSFTVKFNANSAITTNTKSYENGKLVYNKQYFKGSSFPVINKEFRNVKYVKLNDIILPQYGKIKLKKDGYVYDCENMMIDDRYIIITIDEFDDSQNNTYNTSDSSDRVDPVNCAQISFPNPFAHIYPDEVFGKHFYYGGIIGGTRTYKDDQLGNISKLTINLYDSCGIPLSIGKLFCDMEVENHSKTCNDVRHPLNKNHQIFMSFTFGVVETQIATMVKYDK